MSYINFKRFAAGNVNDGPQAPGSSSGTTQPLPTKSQDYPKMIEDEEDKTKKLKQIQLSLQQIENLGKS